MSFNFVNVQAYGIKLIQKFKYTENIVGAHVTQVDFDACSARACYELVTFKITSCIRGYHHYQSIWMPGLVCERNQLI